MGHGLARTLGRLDGAEGRRVDIARYGKASVIALEDLENIFWQYTRSADGLSGPKVPCTTRSRLSGCRPSLSLRRFSFFTTTPPPVSRSSSRTINAHEVGDPTDLMGVITVNDIQRAHMHTSDYACSPARLIEWVAVGITLLLADLVSLGSGKAVLDIPLADGDVPERTLKASIRNLPLSKRY